jgi:hypothetical protein
MTKKSKEQIPQKMKSIYESITRLTDDICQRHLDQEYAELCHKMTAALARKRPSPLLSGAVETLACGIIYALGKINFLFDKSQTPHLQADELCSLFGVASSTASAKAKRIMDLLNIGMMDPKWYRPSKMAKNTMAWLIEINGLIVDVRSMPREIQEEAFRRGLIPYIP